PGLGGETRFALLAKGERPVTVPKGFGFKAQIEGQPQPVVFEASEALTAWPQLSSFHLYRPQVTPNIYRGDREFQVVTALPAGVTLNPGDRLLLGVASPSASSPAELKHAQIAVVERCWESFEATHVAIRGGITSIGFSILLADLSPLQSVGVSGLGLVQMQMMQGSGALPQMFAGSPGAGAPRQMQQAMVVVPPPQPDLPPASVSELFAFKLGASHRHFGHNAPPQETKVDAKGRATVANVSFARRLDTAMGLPAQPSLAARDLPLDAAVDDLSPGTQVVVEGRYGNTASGAGIRRWLLRGVMAVEKRGAGWSALTGPSTVLTLDSHLAAKHGAQTLNYADLRSINVHLVSGAGFRLQAAPRNTDAKRGRDLDFHGTAEDVEPLAGRALLMLGADGDLAEARVAEVTPGAEPKARRFRRVILDREVDYADFGRDAPAVTVHGNVLAATQGKSEDEAVLGDGDRRQVFQTFALPKAPLTYLLAPEETPPQSAELELWVEGVKWQPVDSLFGAKPDDPVYVVREDAEGRSYVQFGDGKTGARLPTGKGNVRARYRSGSGATGPLKPDTTPQPGGRLAGLDKVLMPGPAVGGARPETEDTARIAAPGRMQSLGRLVSLADFEAEALALPGVLKARADWADPNGIPRVCLTVLTGSESEADAEKIAGAMAAVNRARGPRRHTLEVIQGRRRPVALALIAAYDARLRAEALRLAILEALGVAGQEANGVEGDRGLFSLGLRHFGQSAHSSQIIAAVQQVPGVVWMRLTAAGLAAQKPSLRPAAPGLVFSKLPAPKLFKPLIAFRALKRLPGLNKVIGCPADCILSLDADHLDLTLSATTA
ncbi:MAG TPA: hypothetical protein VF859_10560, partial [Burkholderiales bacterium]